MFSKLTLISAILVASGSTVSAAVQKDLKSYTFEQYMSDFNLKYSANEIQTRKALFEIELERIQKHNAAGKSWTETVNKFTAMTPQEKKQYRGRSKGVARNHKPMNLKALPEDFTIKSLDELPTSVDWREKSVVSAVKDQGHCGSCWAFASTAVIESHVALSSGLLFDLSTEQMAMCAPNPDSCGGTGGCEGSTAELAFDYVTGSSGLYQEYQYPYTSYYGVDETCSIPKGESPVATIDGYVQLPANNYSALMNAIATVGPVAISVDASSWSAYAGGIYNGCNQAVPDIDHAVVLVGYGEEDGEKYWLVRNSWSPTWGEQGYIRLARSDLEDTNCGTDVTPQDGTACAGDDEPVKVCGTCGALFDSAYPLSAVAL